MSIILRGSINNSRSAHDPFIFTYGNELPSWVSAQNWEDMQSYSVTSGGSLWHQVLLRIAYENSHRASQYENTEHRLREKTAQYQKNSELIDLLRSWREGDEMEQRDTWEYLKRAMP